MARVTLLLVLVGVLGLYVHPLLSYYETWRASARAHAHIAALERENRGLGARQRDLRQPATIEREARELGMVRRGERPYAVRGLTGR